MAQLNISSFSVTPEQLRELAHDVKDVIIQIAYHRSADSDGFAITANGPLKSLVICPKPCHYVSVTS